MEEKKLVPKLRFPGFTEPWEQRKLGELVTVFSGRDYKHLTEGDIPVYGTGGYMLSVNEALSNDQDAIGIGRKGTIDKPYILKAPFWTVDTLFYAIPKEKVDLNFIFCIFKNVDWRKLDESTGVPSLSKSTITNVDVYCPLFEEQLIVGQFFSWIDCIITLHQRKLEHLKLKKKSLLQKLFPKEGEVNPELRFPGFTDPWEQCKLGEIVKIERGGSPRPIDNYITTDADGLNWIKIGDAPEQGRYIVHAAEKIKSLGLSKTRQVEPGDLILSNSMSFGKPYIMGIHGCIHDGWLLIRNNQNIFDLKFLCNLLGTEQLHAQYRRLAAGSAVNNLNKELVSGTNVGVPSKAEQLKIGQFFENLDQYITLHQRKLEHLQLLKKALLQQLFV